MDWETFIQQYFSNFNFTKPLAATDITSIMEVALPADYLEFMKRYNGGEGVIRKATYLRLFPLKQLQEINEDYCINEFLPNHCIIATSGGGELYGVDASGQYFAVPAIMDEEDKIILGKSFVGFIGKLDTYLGETS